MLGVYLHFPWCRHRCPYCDFPIAVARGGTEGIPHREYADAVIAELDSRQPEWQGRGLDTLYIGGGTPSLWQPEEMGRVIEAIRSRLPGTPRELTLEANPVDCTEERMRAWRDLGIDRLSIGVQSLSNDELITLGRDHRMGEGTGALERAMAGGFRSLSADFILAIPDGASVDPGAARAAEMGLPHLSAYELTVEDGTPLASAVARGELKPLDDELCAERYLAVHHDLSARGYQHYEVSSYALPGHRAVHNSRYWQCLPYLGLGNGASSLSVAGDGSGVRRTNVRSAHRYLRAATDSADHIEAISAAEMRRDRLWLGLRTSDGVADAEVPTELATWLLESGLAERANGRIRPTIRGFLHHDGIARRVVTSLG